MEFRIFLCIPADYDYNFPPLGTPALAGFLKKNNISVYQLDLNIAYRDFLVRNIRCPSAGRKEKEFLLRDILKRFYSRKLRQKYYSGLLPRESDGVSLYLPYDNNSTSSFYFTERMLASKDLFRYLQDENENTFLQFYRKSRILEKIRKQSVQLVGISIISPAQVLASLTLGMLIKKHLPEVHVNIGGQWPTLYRKQLQKRKDLFACFDSIIVFEGETPLLKLAKALKGKKSLCIPNVILRDTLTDWSDNRTEENMDRLACPDFDGLPLEKYWGSGKKQSALTYETSRGCYWSKCAYCVDLPLPKPSYRYKDAKLVVWDMKKLQKKHKAKNLMFGDPGLSPRQMLAISEEIIKKRIKIDWWTMARLDPGFTRRIFDKAYQAGLKQVNFGFESACDRVCDLLDKGNRRERSQRVIRDCSQAGIKVDLQTMIGLPGETLKDGLETVDFLVTNKEFIDNVTFNVYYLTPSNHIYRDPEKYGIEYDRDQRLPFQFFIPFRNLRGMNNQDASLLQNIYVSLVFRKEENKSGPVKKGGKIKKGILKFSLCDDTLRLGYTHELSSGRIKFIQV